MKNKRRDFLRQVAARVAGIPSITPLSLGPTVVEANDISLGATAALQNASNKTLVVIQLMGGNDGLNTVVPYGQAAYLQNRPTIGLQSTEILPIDGDVALNSQMSGMMSLYKSNRMAIIQGVSYPNPNLSHFEATAIWESAEPGMPFSNGWLGRYMDVANALETPAVALNLQELVPQTLLGSTAQPLSFSTVQGFQVAPLTQGDTVSESVVQQLNETACSACSEYNSLVNQMMQSGLDAISASSVIQAAANSYTAQVTYPNNDFANRLKLAAGIIVSSLNPKIVYVTLGGFDTHGNQKATQNALLKQLSDGVTAFYNDLSAQGRANNTLMMTFSEFGRRVKENGSRGTDHGTALPQFMIGGQVSPGLYGNYPSLTNLDSSGNLQWNIDFRQSYATVLEDWFGIAQTEVLDTTYTKLTVV
ncbi:MAG: DUF1501 domain-containing protein [Thaumarchaeota archaeon]|nr:DUF1501 domain-containing protein [Nitrososphaerota archaeon]